MMLRKALATIAAVLVLGVGGPVMAQSATDYPPIFMDFIKGSAIQGTALRPRIIVVQPDRKISNPSLIDYRYDFVPETLTATRDI